MENIVDLGFFFLSLVVKNIEVLKEFYEVLGFEVMIFCGLIEEKWLIMKNG